MIDPATDADIPALAEMLFLLNAHHAAHVPHRFHTDGDQSALRSMVADAMTAGAQILVYRTAGVPRGYLMWQHVERPASALEIAGRHALLDHIHVEPIWRRRGLASRLIARFEEDSRAQGCSGWVVKVHAFNTASKALMRRAGADLAIEVLERSFAAPAKASSD